MRAFNYTSVARINGTSKKKKLYVRHISGHYGSCVVDVSVLLSM